MRNRLIRLTLAGALATAFVAPSTAHAWACLDPVTKALCLVVGTSCRVFDDVTGRGEICQLS